MATSGRGTGIVEYNVQTAIDTENHSIVAHEVVNQGHDREPLTSMVSGLQSVVRVKLACTAALRKIHGDPVTARFWPGSVMRGAHAG